MLPEKVFHVNIIETRRATVKIEARTHGEAEGKVNDGIYDDSDFIEGSVEYTHITVISVRENK